MAAAGSAARVPHHRIAIVGSGFSGLGMAIRLERAGIGDYVVLERADDVGGTWRDNTYPGCQCDVASRLYSFSFAQNPDWSRTYAPQPEIRAYLQRCADESGVRPRIRFGHDVLEAAWDAQSGRWRIETSQGRITADLLVAGAGPLAEPQLPDIPGLDRFEGTIFHSARWDHEHRLDGERVAVIGTGASAIQLVPRIQPRVASLTLFQRTPPWVMPHTDRPVSRLERWVYRRFPPAQRLARAGVYLSREWLVLGLTRHRWILRGLELLGRAHLRRQVRDPELRRALTPGYEVGCKRILMSNHYYPALDRPNAEVVTEGVREVRGRSLITADGAEREVDTIILATGFHVTDPPIAGRVRGRDGRRLSEAWDGSMQAYLGTAVAGFPNLFFLIGPNTGLGHNSMLLMIESQLNYVLDAVRTIERNGGAAVEVRPEVQERFNEWIQRRMRDTVWTAGGCASWYLDAGGRNRTLWPGWTWRFRRLTRTFDPADYVLTGPVAGAAATNGADPRRARPRERARA